MKSAFEVKSARLDTLAIQLRTDNLVALDDVLKQRINQYQELNSMPFLLDVQDFSNPDRLDIAAVARLFSHYGMHIIGLRHNDEAWAPYAAKHQLFFSPLEKNINSEIQIADLAQSLIPEPVVAPTTPEPVQATVVSRPTVLVSTPIRTGQQVYAENADLVVTGMVSEGAEIIADGNIHVYAPLRGRALAGAGGNKKARIFVQHMQAELVSVAGVYRTFEQDLPTDLRNQAVQVYLEDDKLVVSALDAR